MEAKAHALRSRPSLFRRLHTGTRKLVLELQIELLSDRYRQLTHGLALDRAAAVYHEAHFQRSPVLQQRMREEQAELATIGRKLAGKIARLAKLEVRS